MIETETKSFPSESYSEKELEILRRKLLDNFKNPKVYKFGDSDNRPLNTAYSGALNLIRATQFLDITEQIMRDRLCEMCEETIRGYGLDDSIVGETLKEHELSHIETLLRQDVDISCCELWVYFAIAPEGKDIYIGIDLPHIADHFSVVKAALAPRKLSGGDLTVAYQWLTSYKDEMAEIDEKAYFNLVEEYNNRIGWQRISPSS